MEKFSRYARGIHRSPVDSLHNCQWHSRGLDVFFDFRLVNGRVNNRDAGDLRRHNDVIVMNTSERKLGARVAIQSGDPFPCTKKSQHGFTYTYYDVSPVVVKHWSLATMSSYHDCDVMMSAVASQITGVSIVYSNVCSNADQRKSQSSASPAFVRGIHRWPVNSPHKEPVTRKMLSVDDVIVLIPKVIYISLLWSYSVPRTKYVRESKVWNNRLPRGPMATSCTWVKKWQGNGKSSGHSSAERRGKTEKYRHVAL